MSVETDRKLVEELLGEMGAGFVRTHRMTGTEKSKEHAERRHLGKSHINRMEIKRGKKAVTKRHEIKVQRAKARLGTKGGRFRLHVQSVETTANLLEQFLLKAYPAEA